MFKKNLLTKFASFFVILGIVLGASITHVELAFAAALNTLSDTQTSVKVSNLSDHTIQFVTPTGISAAQAITISFPNGWSLGSIGASSTDFATSTSASCTGFTDALINNGAASGISWGFSSTTQSVTLTSGSAVIPANRCVQIRLGANAISQASGTSQITNPSSATSSIINLTAGSDTGQITVNIIADDTVAMTGTVNQSLSFVISTSTIYFGTLSSSNAKYASSTNPLGDTSETVAHTLAVGTNAPSGFSLSVRGQTLTSQQNASNTIDAIGASAASTTVAGIEQFGLRATQAGGTNVSVSVPYSFSTSYGYAATATSSSVLAIGTGATPVSTLSVRYGVNIAAVTEAGTYAANLIYVATANF
jgi:tRNA threonylcarbamoyladenosine modification (KEOPS) complex  Pcc1 subunit